VPSAQTLQTQRDVFASSSFVNRFKRFIGAQFFDGVAPVLSNWSYSSGGESTATYTRNIKLYPGQGKFVTTVEGASVAVTESATPGAVLGYRYMLADGNTTVDPRKLEVSFSFTGTSFTLWYTSISADSTDYELYIDEVLFGTYSTLNGDQNALSRVHTFPYIRNKTVRIRLKRTNNVGNKRLHLEAIEIPKTCRITNQGISGTTVRQYLAYCFGAYGPTVVQPDENFYFVQLGTNDRLPTAPYNVPNGVLSFSKLMGDMLVNLKPAENNIVMMCAGPAVADAPPALTFAMRDVRNAIDGIARDVGLDFIDHFGMMQPYIPARILSDGLHPNAFGHQLMCANITNALIG
jgi:lysophospholipase L1-like esterase